MLALRGVFGLWLPVVERLEAEFVCYVRVCDFFFFVDNMVCLGALLLVETSINIVFLWERPETEFKKLY